VRPFEGYHFFPAELFLALALDLRLGAARLAGAFLSADAFTPLAASRTGFAWTAAASDALGVPLPFRPLGLRPHLPKVRTGAAASRVWHSSNVRLFGSLSFGIFALRDLSVM